MPTATLQCDELTQVMPNSINQTISDCVRRLSFAIANLYDTPMQIDQDKYEIDPTFLNARREAFVILIVFLAFAVYTIGVSYTLGYRSVDSPPQKTELLFGMPRWVVWGVVVPWVLANFVTGWFCFRFMKLDNLDEGTEVAEVDIAQNASGTAEQFPADDSSNRGSEDE